MRPWLAEATTDRPRQLARCLCNPFDYMKRSSSDSKVREAPCSWLLTTSCNHCLTTQEQAGR